MDRQLVESILRGIGADKVRASGDKVTCCCVLAPWTHSKGVDTRPSMVVMPGSRGDPIYKCQACHEKGTLEYLLKFLWTRGRQDVSRWLYVLEGTLSMSAVKVDSDMVANVKKSSELNARKIVRSSPTMTKKVDGKAFFDHLAASKSDSLPEIPYKEYEPYTRAGAPAYALSRGIKEEVCKAFELGDDPRSKRLLFPIRDRKGRLIAISGRLYARECIKCGGAWRVYCKHCGELEEDHDPAEDDDGDQTPWCPGIDERWHPTAPRCESCGEDKPPKYFHRKGFKRNLMLYGEHMKESTPDDRVYVVEGNADVIGMWQDGYRPVVAILGTDPGQPQIEKLVGNWRKIIVVGDGDEAGTKFGKNIRHMVADRIPVLVRKLDKGQDPGGMSREEKRKKIGRPTFDPVD